MPGASAKCSCSRAPLGGCGRPGTDRPSRLLLGYAKTGIQMGRDRSWFIADGTAAATGFSWWNKGRTRFNSALRHAVVIACVLAFISPRPGLGAPDPAPAESAALANSTDAICEALLSAARANNVPLGFFARLIWQESRFNRWAVSRAGAQGVAQFMPKTAIERGLVNPFDPVQAIAKSAELISHLRSQFGNLGLAAAAYNAGPTRVQSWLAGTRSLPQETEAYVRIITGHPATEWTKPESLDIALPEAVRCPADIESAAAPSQPSAPTVIKRPVLEWAVMLFGDQSEFKLLRTYRELQRRHSAIFSTHKPDVVLASRAPQWYRLRLLESTHKGAERLCSALLAAGQSCIVQRN